MKKTHGLAMFAVVLLGTGGLAYGVGHATDQFGAAPTSATAVVADGKARPASDASTPSSTPTVVDPPRKPFHPNPEPLLVPGKAILESGSTGAKVRDMQARLKQIGWFSGDVTEHYGPATVESIEGFQEKRKIPVTGEVDKRTLKRLRAMTRTPTHAELHNIAPKGISTDARLDKRCLTGHAMCIDKTSRTLRWVVDGKVRNTFSVRFGAEYSPTRDGLFHVGWMDATHVSKLYGSAMPYSMFFSGGQAVHYSSDFAARGYNGASHGCVNVRDHDGIKWLFGQVNVGDKVVVYHS